MSAQANGMELNREGFREVANRIDPNTRPRGAAGYDQSTFGAFYFGENWEEPERIECNSVCCIAGHAFIIARSSDEYIDYADGEADNWEPAGDVALNFLGISIKQGEALFDMWIKADKVKAEFGIEVGWEEKETDDPEEVAALLRQIADEG